MFEDLALRWKNIIKTLKIQDFSNASFYYFLRDEILNIQGILVTKESVTKKQTKPTSI